VVDFDVVDLGDPTDAVEEGEVAPDFTRPLVNEEYWEDRALSSLETPLLLVCTTMDGAFPATYTWNELRDRAFDEEYGIEVVGYSISDPYAHKQLIAERGIDYDLFSDPGADVAREYGIDHELDGMTGIVEPRPATFLLGDDRRVAYRWVATEWPDFPDYDELEAAIADLVE